MKTSLAFTPALFFALFFLLLPSLAFAQISSSSSAWQRVNTQPAGGPRIVLDSLKLTGETLKDGYLLTQETTLSLSGSLAAAEGKIELSLNGKEVALEGGNRFAVAAPLQLGKNELSLQLRDSRGESSTSRLFIERIVREKRLALVIGNSAYQHIPPLSNPVNDARLMAQTLRDLNFDVFEFTDLDYSSMNKAIRDFSFQVEEADVIWIYYAGHGLQVDNENYLIPLDAKCESKNTLPFETIKVDQILKMVESNSEKGLNIIVLDACRNNPFKWGGKRGVGGEVGLAAVSPPSGTLIAYSTSPDSFAADGDGSNSTYTIELARQMRVKQRIEDVFINTRLSVEDQSKKEQSPWELARLRGEFFLKR